MARKNKNGTEKDQIIRKKKGKDASQTGTETVFEATARLWVSPIPWLRESES